MEGQQIQSVAAGRHHALAVAASGMVFSWGGSELMTGRPGEPVEEPRMISSLKGKRVQFVAAGEVGGWVPWLGRPVISAGEGGMQHSAMGL